MINVRALNSRDKLALFAGSGILLLIVLVGGIVMAGSTLGKLDRVIMNRSKALVDIGKLRQEALDLQQKIRQAEEKLAKTAETSPVTFTEGLVNRIAGKGNLAYLRPLSTASRDGLQVETLELKVEHQSLEQILRLFWEIDNAAVPMHLTSLRLQRRFDNHALLDATLTMNTYRK